MTTKPARSMQVDLRVGPENWAKHRKGPNAREDLEVTAARSREGTAAIEVTCWRT